MKNHTQQNLLKNKIEVIISVWFLISLIITIFNPVVLADNGVASKLYNSKGRLIADTTFQIKTAQLKKFTAIEPELLKQLINNLSPPPAHQSKNDSILEIIICFTLDDKGNWSKIHIAKINSDDGATNSKNIPKNIQVHSDSLFFNSILKSKTEAIQLKFKAAKGKCEEYYLPYKYQSVYGEFKKQIENGWLLFQRVKLIDNGEQSVPDYIK